MYCFQQKNPSLNSAVLNYLGGKPLNESDFGLIVLYLRDFVNQMDIPLEISSQLAKLKRKNFNRFMQLLSANEIYPF